MSRRVRATLEVLERQRRLSGQSRADLFGRFLRRGLHRVSRGVCRAGVRRRRRLHWQCAAIAGRSWARQRLRERLSLAIVCHTREPAGPMVEELDGPMFQATGVRAETLILPRQGHQMPDAAVMERAFGQRVTEKEWRRVARQRRGYRSRVRVRRCREKSGRPRCWKRRGGAPETGDGGRRIIGTGGDRQTMERPAAGDAQGLIAEYTSKTERPWEAEQRQRQQQVDERGGRVRTAGGAGNRLFGISARICCNWRRCTGRRWRNGPDDAELQAEAEKHLAGLRELAAKPPAAGEKEMAAVALKDVRFQQVSEVTLGRG